MSKYTNFIMWVCVGLMMSCLAPDTAMSQPERELQIDYIHDVQINGETAQAIVTGTANLGTGVVVVEGTISHYIAGYRFWPSSWITLIMTSILPAVSLERGEARNLLTITDGQLGYEVRAITENEFAAIRTEIQVILEGDTIVAHLKSEGESNYPDLVGMGEGKMEILQTPNPDGGFTETGTKQLLTVEGEMIEIPHYAEFVGVELPAAQRRTVEVKVLEASDDLTRMVLEYTGVTQPAQDKAFEPDFYYANNERVLVNVALDRIGVVAFDEVEAEAVAALAQEFDLRLLEEFPTKFFILGLREPADRQSLVQLTREVQRAGENILKETGLILTAPADPATPILLTDEFIAQFEPQVTREEIDQFNDESNVEIVNPDAFVENQYVLTVTDDSPADALAIANRYHESPLTVFAEPNLWQLTTTTQEVTPNDPLYATQWHHRNTGAGGGLTDADGDSSWAWDITLGSANVVIGFVDDGYDLAHQDLQPNLFINPGETPGNGLDDDGSGFVDDINGWDVTSCPAAAPAGCGDNDPSAAAGDHHGTAVAGVAAARGDNSIGVSGSCPTCRILPIRRPFGLVANAVVAMSYNYAVGIRNAGVNLAVLNNSWGYTSPASVVPTVVANAINNAVNAGIVVLFAGGNQNSDGWCVASIPSLANIVAVSSSTNLDRKAGRSAFGNCIDILAPSYHYDPGTLGIVTTDRTGSNGYNNTSPICPTTLTENANQNYTNCFSGTSSATPLASGVVGLIRSLLGPTTTAPVSLWVRRLLQDTADKIEPGTANYADNVGFSSPASGIATHSWGRINAYEALRVAAPTASGGRGGVDVFIRDNRLDWGNTTGYLGEQGSNVRFESPRGFIPHWESVDIKVDAPPYHTTLTSSALFDVWPHEDPISGQVNRVYVRVRNRGPVTARSVTVTLHWAFAGTALPALPGNFWTGYTSGSYTTTNWNFVGSAPVTNLQYSGASVAGCPGRIQPACDGGVDNAQIVQFNWTGPPLNPALPAFRHFCLFAVINSPDDTIDPISQTRFAPDNITPNDNNITHRNVAVQDPLAGGGRSEMGFFVRNPFDEPIRTMLRIDLADPQQQENWGIDLSGVPFNQPFSMEPGEEIPATLYVALPEEGTTGSLSVVQLRLDQEVPEVMGGMTFEFLPQEAQVKVTFGGHPVDNSRVQEAVLHAVAWKELTEQIFPDQNLPVAIDLWEVGPVLTDAREVPFDLELARMLLAETDFAGGFHLFLFFSSEDETLATMAEGIAQQLSELGIDAELSPVPASDASAKVAATIAAGEAVLWLSR